MHIHFIGICGTFMAGIARIATELGHEVTGSDKAFYPPMCDQLAELGIATYCGYDADVWDKIKPDLIVVGNVCTRGMPIIEEMLRRNLNHVSGPQWLYNEVLVKRKVLAVAGTHGKTTTTSMLTHILLNNQIDAGYLIGGVTMNLEHSARLGTQEYFVIEADEYDSAYFDKRPKFMHYAPHVFSIANMEFDHADIYENVEAIIKQFHFGIRLVNPDDFVILGEGDNMEKLKQKGIWSNVTHRELEYDIVDNKIIKKNENNKLLALIPNNIIGEHNKRNALTAALIAEKIGISVEKSMLSLASFLGVKRRLEEVYNHNNITIYDDFAHHPTAIEQVLKTLKNQYPKRRLIAVCEPRSNTMKMGIFKDMLNNAFSYADVAYIYVPKNIAWLPSGPFTILDDIEKLQQTLLATLTENDQLVIMSNGDFENLTKKLITALNAKKAN